jgi:hypothetical protein
MADRDWDRAKRDSRRSADKAQRVGKLPVDQQKPPTAKQLDYLAALSDRLGVAYVPPPTAHQASIAINLLKARR